MWLRVQRFAELAACKTLESLRNNLPSSASTRTCSYRSQRSFSTSLDCPGSLNASRGSGSSSDGSMPVRRHASAERGVSRERFTCVGSEGADADEPTARGITKPDTLHKSKTAVAALTTTKF